MPIPDVGEVCKDVRILKAMARHGHINYPVEGSPALGWKPSKHVVNHDANTPLTFWYNNCRYAITYYAGSIYPFVKRIGASV